MKSSKRKTNPILKLINSSLIDLPCPSNINSMWSFGSILGICLMIQLTTGTFLSMHYCPETSMSFSALSHIMRDVNLGWFMRIIHANGSSVFFFTMYIHVSRGIYFNSFHMKEVWMSGITILLLMMGTAFMGYVLPWGQMSFWAAAVITNLLSAIPMVGMEITQWLWGGFSVNNATLNRFFTLHFILPMMVMSMVMVHLMYLHKVGSSNPMGVTSDMDKVSFHPYFYTKDMIGFTMMISALLVTSMTTPMWLNDPENFIPANPMSTPTHIQPEWYFLFAYAILRSIPNKLGGVMALVSSILILISLPLTMKNKAQSSKFYPINKTLLWMFMTSMLTLSWIGSKPVETPFEMIGIFFTVFHFSFFMILPILTKIWDKLNY
uniref:Cytochrome b n=1 Tax=Endeis sp. JZ-2022 TaxID=2992007 RepID=A0A9E8ADJ6_9CHEL|nr:cytochrome b [Endeis sp. JZ-2022]